MTEPSREPNAKSVRLGRRSSYRASAGYQAVRFVAVAILGLVTSVVNSRTYGIHVIGEYALAMATVGVVRLISTTKERPALVRELALVEPRHPRVTGLFAATLAYSVALTAVVGGVALVVTHFLLRGPIAQPSLFVPIVVNVAGYVVIGNTCENINVVFNGFRAARETFAVNFGMSLVFLAISIPLGVVNGTIWGLTIATVGSTVTMLMHQLFLIRPFMRFRVPRHVIRDGFRTLPGMLRFGLKITPGALADGGSTQSGTWMVGLFDSISAVGAYGRAYMLVTQLIGLTAINDMLFPTLVERRAKEDHLGYARALVDSLRYIAIALLVPFAVCAGVAKGVMHIFGPGFERGAPALTVLLLAPALTALSQMQRGALNSLDRPGIGSVSGTLRLVTTLAIGASLTWKMGSVGAALGLVLGLVADVIFATRIVVRNLAVPTRGLWPVHQWLTLGVACGGAYVAGHLIYAALGFPVGLFAGGAAGGAIFLLTLWLGGGVNDRDRQRFRDMRRMAARRGRFAAPNRA